MAISLNRICIKCVALAMLVLNACATHGSSERLDTYTLLSASSDVNPDISGRPSPVVLRVFQLKGAAEFSHADFFALYAHEKETLGANIIDIEEFELRPGERLETRLPLARDARYIGAIAGFRDLSNAQWRTLQIRPSRSIFFRETVAISVDRSTLTLSVKH